MRHAFWVAGATAAAITAYMTVIRPWHRRWGVLDDEAVRPMPGDEVVPTPNIQTTRAITINARPQDIFPWLAQMGYQRGGLYSYDWLDRLFGILDQPSTERVLTEFQELKTGDIIPVGRGNGFPVTSLERNQLLVLSGEQEGVAWSWAMALVPLDEIRTRFISRNRIRYPQTPANRLSMLWLNLTAFLMTRKWLLNIKRRAETLFRQSIANGNTHTGFDRAAHIPKPGV